MDIKTAGEIVKKIAREKTYDLKPEDCIIFDSQNLKVLTHYTFVFFPSEEIKQLVEKYSEELKKIDPSLVITPPKFYHATLFHCSLDKNIDEMIATVERVFNKPFDFTFENLVATPEGISINVCPKTMDFIHLRQELYQIAGFEFLPNDRCFSSWIAFARFGQPLGKKLHQYFKNHFDDKIGEFSTDKIYLYESESKILENAKLLKTFKVK